jgi:hypothetical protein
MPEHTPGQWPAPNADDQRADLMAMLSASRELGPEMDSSVVDSYMSRHAAEAERDRQRAVGQPGRPGTPWDGQALWRIGMGIIGGAVLLGIIASFVFAPATQGGHGGFPFWPFWLFFPWIFFVLFRRGAYRSRRRYWYQAEDGRRVDVYERTRGYGSRDQYGPQDSRGPYGSGDPNSAGYSPHSAGDPYSTRDPRDPYAPPPEHRTDYRPDRREPPDSVV